MNVEQIHDNVKRVRDRDREKRETNYIDGGKEEGQ